MESIIEVQLDLSKTGWNAATHMNQQLVASHTSVVYYRLY